MAGITLSIDEIKAAPPEVRRWLEPRQPIQHVVHLQHLVARRAVQVADLVRLLSSASVIKPKWVVRSSFWS